MRLYSALVFLGVAILAGCSPSSSHEAFDRCLIDQREGWKLISRPQNSATLLSLQSPGGFTAGQMPREAEREHWFQRSPDELKVCRLPPHGECDREFAMVRFVRDKGQWVVPDEILIAVCAAGSA